MSNPPPLSTSPTTTPPLSTSPTTTPNQATYATNHHTTPSHLPNQPPHHTKPPTQPATTPTNHTTNHPHHLDLNEGVACREGVFSPSRLKSLTHVVRLLLLSFPHQGPLFLLSPLPRPSHLLCRLTTCFSLLFLTHYHHRHRHSFFCIA